MNWFPEVDDPSLTALGQLQVAAHLATLVDVDIVGATYELNVSGGGSLVWRRWAYLHPTDTQPELHFWRYEGSCARYC